MADHSHDAVAWRELLTRQYAASLVLVCAGVWLHAADSLIVATMLPAIVDEIGGRKLVSWTVSLYEIGSICLLYTSPSPRDLSTSRMPSSA